MMTDQFPPSPPMHIGEFTCIPYNPGDMTCYRIVWGIVNQEVILFGFGVNGRVGSFHTFGLSMGVPTLDYVYEKMFKGEPRRITKYELTLAHHILCYMTGVLPWTSERDEAVIKMIWDTRHLLPPPNCELDIHEWHKDMSEPAAE
jgi:hypothetical protein